MTREPATTTRAVLMAAVEMRLPSERIEAILDYLLAAARAEALEEALAACGQTRADYPGRIYSEPIDSIARRIRAMTARILTPAEAEAPERR